MKASTCLSDLRGILLLLLLMVAVPVCSGSEAASPLRILFLGDNGHHRPADLFKQLQPVLATRGIEMVYTDNMASLQAGMLKGFDGLVMNPAGFTYAGFALKDCVKGAGLPYVEVHISNIAKRSIHCVLSDVAEGFITGFGMHTYILGLDAMLEILRARRREGRS